MKKKILIINGPNLNLLGKRQPEIYGSIGMKEILEDLQDNFPEIEVSHKQSAKEFKIIKWIHKYAFYGKKKYIGVVINAGAFSHYSYAIADAIAMSKIPIVNVHISDLSQREPWRQNDIIAPYCKHSIVGKGIGCYKMAIQYLLK